MSFNFVLNFRIKFVQRTFKQRKIVWKFFCWTKEKQEFLIVTIYKFWILLRSMFFPSLAIFLWVTVIVTTWVKTFYFICKALCFDSPNTYSYNPRIQSWTIWKRNFFISSSKSNCAELTSVNFYQNSILWIMTTYTQGLRKRKKREKVKVERNRKTEKQTDRYKHR